MLGSDEPETRSPLPPTSTAGQARILTETLPHAVGCRAEAPVTGEPAPVLLGGLMAERARTGPLAVLVITGSASAFRLIEWHCQQQRSEITGLCVSDRGPLMDALSRRRWDAVVFDDGTPGVGFLEAWQMLKHRSPDTPVIVATRNCDEERAIDLLREGVADVLDREQLGRLGLVIERHARATSERRQRVATDHELRLLRTVVHTSAPALLVTDRAGVITWISPGLAAVIGFGCQDAVGRTPRDLLDAAGGQGEIFERVWQTVRAGEIWRGELTLRRRDGRAVAVDQIVAPVMDDAGALAHTVWIKRDLTDQKHVRSQLLQCQKMESVGRLAGGIAHDFNNLITAINGTAELALLRLHEGDPLRRDFERIRETGKRAASLTGQLLAFSRKQPMSATVVHMGGVLLGLRDMLERLLGENVTLDVAAGPDDACVLADRGQLEQVVMNLAINARDAMPNGGTLTIEASIAELDDSYAATHPGMHPGPHVALVVTDTGVGMDDATRERIFEPFFTTKDAGQGTGLGLATVYGIVKQSNGSIWVYSELGRGTTFRIYLPLVASSPRAAVQPVSSPPIAVTPGPPASILVVEDEDFLRDLANRMLETSGYTVLLAESGEEALDLLRARDGRVDLLLTDVVLPGITGRELAEQVEVTYPAIKVIYTSGYTEDVIRRHGLLEGQMYFISKPYTRAGLTRMVRHVMTGE